MQFYEATILGIIQGLTEFLPVSSSGHLVIFQSLFGLKEPQLFFNVTVHMGTLFAILAFFRNDILNLVAGAVRVIPRIVTGKVPIRTGLSDPDAKPLFLIIAGSVPTAIIGLALHSEAERLFSSVGMVGGMLLLTGFLLWVTKRKLGNPIGPGHDRFTLKDALIIGLVQGIAVIPGISRSGSTIAAALPSRNQAGNSGPVLVSPLDSGHRRGGDAEPERSFGPPPECGPACARRGSCGRPGRLRRALRLLVTMLKDGRLHLFAPYCWLAGGIAILFSV
jgi:undecaprenyl-diphosphatase